MADPHRRYFRLLNLARYATYLVGLGGYAYWYATTRDPRFFPVAGLFAVLLAWNAGLYALCRRPRGKPAFVSVQVLLTALIGHLSPPGTGWFVYVYFVTLSLTLILLEGAAAIPAGLGVAGLALAQAIPGAGGAAAGLDAAGLVAAFLFVFASSLMSKAQLLAWARGQPAPGASGGVGGFLPVEAGAATPPAGTEALTPREVEVLRLVAEGLSNREIAARLYLSEGTVKNHISSIYAKLNLRDRAQAAIFAIERGLVPPPRPRDSVQA